MRCRNCSKEIHGEDAAFCPFCGTPVHEPAAQRRRLTRLPDEGKLGGVCAGLAAYFNTDVTLIRLAWVILSIVPGVIVGGVIAYLAAWIVLPKAAGVAERLPPRRQLVRSTADRKIAGVCGGLAEYLGVDSTVVRLAWIVLSIYPGAVVCGILAYVIAWVVIPPAPTPTLSPSPSTS